MQKNIIRVGSPRKKSDAPHTQPNKTEYKLLSILGIFAVCICLIIPMNRKNSVTSPSDEIIAVMKLEGASDSEGGTKDKLTRPDVSTSADSEWSIFEYIGEAVASLITRFND